MPEGLNYETIGYEGMQALLKQAMDSVPKEYTRVFGEQDKDGNWKNAVYEKQYMGSETYDKAYTRYDEATKQYVTNTVQKTRTVPKVETLDADSYKDYQKKLDALSDEARSEQGQNERVVVRGNGLFTEWVGYAPVMKPGADPDVDVDDYMENVRFAGYGETGRIMGMFIQHKTIEGAGWAEGEQPAYNRKLWDDRGSWMKAPNLRSVVDIAMTIALSSVSGGVGGMLLNAALNMVDDAVFTMMDMANGMDPMAAMEGLGKKALVSVASSAASGVANGFGSVKSAAGGVAASGTTTTSNTFMDSGLKGVLGLKDSVIGSTLLKGTELMATNITSSAINSVNLKGLLTGGDAFDERAFKQGAFGKSAMTSVAAGMAGQAVTTGLNSYAFTDGSGHGLQETTFHTKSIQNFNGLAGGLASSAATYAMTGNAKLNVMNFRDIAQSFDLDFFKNKQNPGEWNSVGMLEMNFGKDGFGMNMGMGGTDVSASNLGASAYGFRDTAKISYAKMSNALGNDSAISKLNAINKLAWTGENGNADNELLAKSLWEGTLKSKFTDLGTDEFGRFDEKKKNTLLLSNALRGNNDEVSAKLASVMSHESSHQGGNYVEKLAYQEGLKTYLQVNSLYDLPNDAKFTGDMIKAITDPENAKASQDSVHHWLVRADGQIFNDGKTAVTFELPEGMQQTAWAEGLPAALQLYDDGTLDGGLAFLLAGMNANGVNDTSRAAAKALMTKNGYKIGSDGSIKQPSMWKNFLSNYGYADDIDPVGGYANQFDPIKNHIYGTISERSGDKDVIKKLELENLKNGFIAIAAGGLLESTVSIPLPGKTGYTEAVVGESAAATKGAKGPYIPRDAAGNPIPIRQQNVGGVDIPLPDPAAQGPHTVLGGKVGSDGVTVYRQSATFGEQAWPSANGQNVPWSRVDWTSHPYLPGSAHPDPHQHPFFWNGTQWQMGGAVPFN